MVLKCMGYISMDGSKNMLAKLNHYTMAGQLRLLEPPWPCDNIPKNTSKCDLPEEGKETKTIKFSSYMININF